MLKFKYKNKEDIPEGYEKLYTEKGGEWVFTGISGLKTEEDIQALQTANRNERELHDETKLKLRKYTDIVNEEGLETLQKDIYDLEDFRESGSSKNKDNPDAKFTQQDIDTAIEKEVKRSTREFERTLKAATDVNTELTTENETLKTERRTSVIKDAVVLGSSETGLLSGTMEDVQEIALRICEVTDSGKVIVKEGNGDISGLDIGTVLKEEWPDKKPYFYEPSKSGGGKGGKDTSFNGNNPFHKDSINLTDQSKMIRDTPDKAKRAIIATGGNPQDFNL